MQTKPRSKTQEKSPLLKKTKLATPAKSAASAKTATKNPSKPSSTNAAMTAAMSALSAKVSAQASVALKATVKAPLKTTMSVSTVSVASVIPVAVVNPDAALLAPKTPARSNRGYRPGAVEATKTLAELSDEPIEFKVGDNAVYPGHGVGRVNAIETKEIAGTQLTFYSIQILDSGMKIMVPQANVKNVGLRPIISKEEATLVVSILKQTDVKIDNQTWNRRYREYMEKIKTGGVREIAEVLRDLFLLKVDKELSFGERKMLDTARSLLIKELILATGRDELMKEAEVKAILDLS